MVHKRAVSCWKKKGGLGWVTDAGAEAVAAVDGRERAAATGSRKSRQAVKGSGAASCQVKRHGCAPPSGGRRRTSIRSVGTARAEGGGRWADASSWRQARGRRGTAAAREGTLAASDRLPPPSSLLSSPIPHPPSTHQTPSNRDLSNLQPRRPPRSSPAAHCRRRRQASFPALRPCRKRPASARTARGSSAQKLTNCGVVWLPCSTRFRTQAAAGRQGHGPHPSPTFWMLYRQSAGSGASSFSATPAQGL